MFHTICIALVAFLLTVPLYAQETVRSKERPGYGLHDPNDPNYIASQLINGKAPKVHPTAGSVYWQSYSDGRTIPFTITERRLLPFTEQELVQLGWVTTDGRQWNYIGVKKQEYSRPAIPFSIDPKSLSSTMPGIQKARELFSVGESSSQVCSEHNLCKSCQDKIAKGYTGFS